MWRKFLWIGKYWQQKLPHPLGQLKMFPNVSCFPLQNENFTKQLSLQLNNVSLKVKTCKE